MLVVPRTVTHRTPSRSVPVPEPQPLLDALKQRKAAATTAILLLNIGVFGALMLTGGPGLANLTRFGAKVNDLVAAGEYWRLLTCMFLHAGVAHLVFNCWALSAFGRDIEKIYGTGRYVACYLACGLAGSYASYHFSLAPSVGASGAIFGLVGMSLVFGFRYRALIPPAMRSRFGFGVLPAIIFNLVYGFAHSGYIDNYAHLGGLAAGILLGLAVPARLDELEDPLIR